VTQTGCNDEKWTEHARGVCGSDLIGVKPSGLLPDCNFALKLSVELSTRFSNRFE
jgi:hypothetical protein